MKEFVLDHRTSVVASISAIMLVWAVFVMPGGAPWTRIAWVTALAFLSVTAATVLFSRARTPSMAQVIRGVEADPKLVDAANRPRD